MEQPAFHIPAITPDHADAFVHSKRALGLARWRMEEQETRAHRLSDLAIRKFGGSYALVAYLYYYDKDSYRLKLLPRPAKWLIMDIVTGQILYVVDCADIDFSPAFFEELCSTALAKDATQDVSDEHYREIYVILDEVRRKLITGGALSKSQYAKYLDLIQENTPVEYQRFLSELSDPAGKKKFLCHSQRENA